MLKNFKIVQNNTTPWLCYRDLSSPLVYFVHSKCACIFYKELFSKLRWEPCTVTDIDWGHNRVFSYIRNPLIKQRIGIIEWFYFNDLVHLLEENASNDNFFKLLSEIGYIDHHSLSIYDHLGDKSQLVHWIPIDQPSINHKQKTVELIEQYSTISSEIKEWFLKRLPVHVSTGFKKECCNRLIELPVHPMVTKSIDYDWCLYDSVTKPIGFEPANYQLRVKKLEETGLTNISAQEIADNEVASNEYLNWNNN